MSLRYIGGLVSPSVNPLAANVTTSPNVAQYNGVFTLQQQAQALTSNQWATDPYYKNTTLLLHADGKANGSQNNTFLDSSTNNFTITRNGNTTQGSFTPYGPTWSNYFDGSSYLAPSSNPVGATGAFTVECWVYVTGSAASQAIYAQYAAADAGRWAIFWNDTANKFTFSIASSSYVSTNTYAANTWHHIAWVRDGSNNLSFYIDGVRDSTNASISTSLSVQNPFIANRYGGATPYTGYISNLRITNNAVYTGTTYTVPTAPLTAISGTTLLTCQSNRFIDNSSNAYTFTIGSSPTVQRFSPFAPQYQYTPAVIGGSGYFDGTGDMLQTPSITIGTNAFCFECWLYPTATQGSNAGIFVGSTSSSLQASYYSTTGLGIATTAVAWQLFETTNLPVANAWNHVAFVRSGTGTNQTSIYLNGVRVANGTVASNFAASVYQLSTTNASGTVFQGYISDARLTNGSTPYDATQSTLTVPTAPLTTSASNTVLLLSMTNAGIYDNAMMNNLETVGNAQVSTSVVKYGSGSMYFDGSGDYLNSAAGNLNCDLSNGDFTVEGWVYFNSTSGSQFVLGRTAFNITTGAQVQYSIYASSGSLVVRPYQSTTDYSINVGSFAAGTWYHIALVRQGNVFSGYLNGIKSSTTQTISGALNNDTAWYGVLLGNQQVSGVNQYFNGYLDDVRITKGVARYTSNFIPPKVALSNQ